MSPNYIKPENGFVPSDHSSIILTLSETIFSKDNRQPLEPPTDWDSLDQKAILNVSIKITEHVNHEADKFVTDL